MNDNYLEDLIVPAGEVQKRRRLYCSTYPVSGVFPGKSLTSPSYDSILFGLNSVNLVSEPELRSIGTEKYMQQTQSLKGEENTAMREDYYKTEQISQSMIEFIHLVRSFRKAIGKIYGGGRLTKMFVFMGLWGIEMERGYLIRNDVKRFRRWKTNSKTDQWIDIYVRSGFLVEMKRTKGQTGTEYEKQRSRFFLSSRLKASLIRAWGLTLGDRSFPRRISSELLPELRREAGYSQYQLAEAIGVPRSALREIEAGYRMITEEMNERLIEKLYFLLPRTYWPLHIKQEVELGVRKFPYRPKQVIGPKKKEQHYIVASYPVFAKPDDKPPIEEK